LLFDSYSILFTFNLLKKMGEYQNNGIKGRRGSNEQGENMERAVWQSKTLIIFFLKNTEASFYNLHTKNSAC
jgi:hypothetical protein